MNVTTTRSAKVTLPTDEQILITREFDAPRHLVYQAYTTPELVKRWWGAKRGVVTVAEIDLRVGGSWRSVGVMDDGQEIAFHGEYREIVPNERIVSTEVFEGVTGGQGTLNTSTFTETDGRTTLTILVGRRARRSATRSSNRGWRTASRTRSICSRTSPSRSAETAGTGRGREGRAPSRSL